MERVLRELKKLAAMQARLEKLESEPQTGSVMHCADCNATMYVLGTPANPLEERCERCRRILLDNENRLIRWVGASVIPDFTELTLAQQEKLRR